MTRIQRLERALLLCSLVISVTAGAYGQEGAATTIAPAATQPAEPPKSTWEPKLDYKYDWLIDPTPSVLSLQLAPMTSDALSARAASAVGALQTVTGILADKMIAQLKLTTTKPVDQDALGLVNQDLEKVTQLRNELVTRTNIVLEALEAKGGDVAGPRAYVNVVEKLQPDGTLVVDKPALSEEERRAQEVAERVAAAVAAVRETPPVHERDEPWNVSVSELELEMQPLRKEQIAERVQKWIDILQRELRERIRLDIAVNQVEDGAERQALADEAARQHEIVQKIVERVRAALVLLQKRGGETREYQDYIANATGQRLNISNPAVLWAQVKSWVRSPTGGIGVGLSILKFLLIVIGFWIIARIVAAIVSTTLHRVPGRSNLLHRFVTDMTRRMIIVIGFVVAATALGVSIGPLMAAIGAAGLVIGLALQGTLSNFASGILILLTRPFDVGDVINAGGVFGKVDAMNVVSTRVLTFDNQVMLVPNNQIWNGVITNLTALPTRRVDLVFGISYTDDIERAIQFIDETVRKHPKVIAEPAPMIKVSELSDSSVNLIVRPWSATSDYWDVYWDLTRQIKERFDAEGVSIPFPQRDVHVYNHAPGA